MPGAPLTQLRRDMQVDRLVQAWRIDDQIERAIAVFRHRIAQPDIGLILEHLHDDAFALRHDLGSERLVFATAAIQQGLVGRRVSLTSQRSHSEQQDHCVHRQFSNAAGRPGDAAAPGDHPWVVRRLAATPDRRHQGTTKRCSRPPTRRRADYRLAQLAHGGRSTNWRGKTRS